MKSGRRFTQKPQICADFISVNHSFQRESASYLHISCIASRSILTQPANRPIHWLAGQRYFGCVPFQREPYTPGKPRKIGDCCGPSLCDESGGQLPVGPHFPPSVLEAFDRDPGQCGCAPQRARPICIKLRKGNKRTG